MSRVKVEKQYLTAISVSGGIITLIELDGTIGYYRQRGMNRVDTGIMMNLIAMGVVNPRWSILQEIPKHYVISFEDPAVMGRAYVTFKVR